MLILRGLNNRLQTRIETESSTDRPKDEKHSGTARERTFIASSCPALCRASTSSFDDRHKQDVDARDKPGQDERDLLSTLLFRSGYTENLAILPCAKTAVSSCSPD